MSFDLKSIQTIEEIEIENKVVFIRVDFNVPMVDGKITDDSRIRGALPTIEYALGQGAKVVLGSHFGRPKKDKKEEFSLEAIADHLSEIANLEVILVEDPLSEAPRGLLGDLKDRKIILLENLRFIEGETTNGHELSDALKPYIDVYINDAFGASHRTHSSIVDLARQIAPHGCGLLVKKEIEMLNQVLESDKKPYYAILGGAKVSDKIEVINQLMDVVDGFIIGGAMANTFLKAKGVNMGDSLVEKDKLSYAKDLIERLKVRDKMLLLPEDHQTANSITSETAIKTSGESVTSGKMSLDIGPKTIKSFCQAIDEAQTIFWNGPMGVFEKEAFSKGTFAIAEAISKNSGITIVGGGDSASAARQSGHAEEFTHISTGGGASLEYLQGESLPGLMVLTDQVVIQEKF